MHRVTDRERKYKWRKNEGGCRWRGTRRPLGATGSQAGGLQRGERIVVHGAASGRRVSVRGYRSPSEATVSSRETHQEVPKDDRETSAGCRPRAPPSA